MEDLDVILNCKMCKDNNNGWCKRLRTNNMEDKHLKCNGAGINLTDTKVTVTLPKVTTTVINTIASEQLALTHIKCVDGVSFKDYLKYRMDLDTEEWRYFEKLKGTLIYFRKDKIIMVEEI